MVNKNTTKKTRKARKNFSLIKFICIILFFVDTILFVINAVTDYKTYTNSEIVKANVINVSGTKNDMLNVKYRYNYDSNKYDGTTSVQASMRMFDAAGVRYHAYHRTERIVTIEL